MFHTVVTVAAAAMASFSAAAGWLNAGFVTKSLTDYGVPRAWWPWLSTAKATGAAGLLAGLAVPVVGVAAGVGLALYFAGAAVTVVRAGFARHVPFPLLYLAPVVLALVS